MTEPEREAFSDTNIEARPTGPSLATSLLMITAIQAFGMPWALIIIVLAVLLFLRSGRHWRGLLAAGPAGLYVEDKLIWRAQRITTALAYGSRCLVLGRQPYEALIVQFTDQAAARRFSDAIKPASDEYVLIDQLWLRSLPGGAAAIVVACSAALMWAGLWFGPVGAALALALSIGIIAGTRTRLRLGRDRIQIGRALGFRRDIRFDEMVACEAENPCIDIAMESGKTLRLCLHRTTLATEGYGFHTPELTTFVANAIHERVRKSGPDK